MSHSNFFIKSEEFVVFTYISKITDEYVSKLSILQVIKVSILNGKFENSYLNLKNRSV